LVRQITRDDHADAALICGVATALRDWGVHTGQPPPLKILREAVWFYWQAPRLRGKKVPPKYPRAVGWSEAAARLVASGEPRKGRLVIEHIEPMNRALRWLVEEAPEVDEVIAQLPSRLRCVVVTKDESVSLPDDGTPDERYAKAGLNLASFRALDDWDFPSSAT